MSNEITVVAQVQVNNVNLQDISQPKSFQADQATANGPSPGAVTATTGGTNVSFAQLTLPGICTLHNCDQNNYVSYGLYETGSPGVFRPFGELLPGETNIVRFSRTLLTANAGADVLRLVAHSASVVVLVKCLDT